MTFREDTNMALDKQTAQNRNIIRKWSQNILIQSILMMIEIMKQGLSLKKKRFAIILRLIQYLEEVLPFKRYGRNNLENESIHAFVVWETYGRTENG